MTKSLSGSLSLFFFRGLVASGLSPPPGSPLPARDGLHVAGAEATGREELLGCGGVCVHGGGHGPRAADGQAQVAADCRVEIKGEL